MDQAPDSGELATSYRGYLDALNRRDYDALASYVHDEVTHNGRRLTRADYAAMLAADVRAIPDLHYEPLLVLTGDDHVACRLWFDCTPARTFAGIEPDGGRLAFAEHVFYRYHDGRIFQVWSLIDTDAIRRQVEARRVTDLAVERAGPRGSTPVVLIHAGVADRRMWDPVWPAVTAVRDVIRYDLRGFGKSATAPDGPLDHVADLFGLLDALDVPRCHLVGASFGSGVAVEAALSRPERVSSLLLCPPGGSLLATMTPALRAFIDRESAALDEGNVDEAVEANIDTWVVGVDRDQAELDAEVLASVRLMQRRVFDLAAQWGDPASVELEPPALDRLTELQAPICVLVGRHDLDTVLDATDRIVAAVPTTRRLDWPDVAHLPCLEQPTRFAGTLLDWLAATG